MKRRAGRIVGRMRVIQEQNREITHIVQARITVTRDTHVCWHCGDNASFLCTGYEAATQVHADQITSDARDIQTIDDALRHANASPVSESIYQATILEQKQGLPQEHTRHYYCFSCLSTLLSGITGVVHSGQITLAKLLIGPPLSALWVMRDIQADRVGLMNTPFQDVKSVIQALRHDQDIPRIEITEI